MTTWRRGTDLTPAQQRVALVSYIHRYTRDFKPLWVEHCERVNFDAPPLHFDSDRDWLHNTEFAVTKAGEFDKRKTSVMTNPTWPDNPELRWEHTPPVYKEPK